MGRGALRRHPVGGVRVAAVAGAEARRAGAPARARRAGVVRAVSRAVVDDDDLALWTLPWQGGIVHETPDLGAASGPFRQYQRRVEVHDLPDGRHQVVSTAEFQLALPYWGWLF